MRLGERTYLLIRVVLDLQLDARGLACDQEAADDLALHPYLATLADDHPFRVNPVEVDLEPFDHVYRLLVRHQLLLAFPEYSNARSNFVP